MPPALLADLVVAVHVGYVSFVVVGQLLLLAGLLRRWAWVRSPWFRVPHLVAILVVAGEAVFDIACPLTVWEAQLRVQAGQTAGDASFVGRWLHELIFVDLSPAALTALHVGFGLLVLLTFLLAPPRFRRRVAPAATMTP